MIRCERVRLDPGRAAARELRVLGDRVSRLWNAANYVCRQAFLAKQGVPRGASLERTMKGTPEYRQLPSDIAQEVLKKLTEAWSSYWTLRTKWIANPKIMDKPGLPRYRKHRNGDRPFDLIPIKHPRSYALDSRHCRVTLPRDRRRTPSARLQTSYRGRRRFDGQCGRAEMRYDRARRRWYFAWSVKIDSPAPAEGDRCAAVDLGVRLMASLSIEGEAQALHFDNREALKDWDFLGREIAREQQTLAGTRGRLREDRAPSSRAITRLHQKRRQRLEHAVRAMAAAIATTCVAYGVARVFLGWPRHVLRDARYGSSLWAGRIHGFWSFDQVLSRLAWALEARGIAAVRVGERGSSSTCSQCGSRRVVRQRRWRLACRACGSVIHADQAGSRNILKFEKPSVCWAGAEAAPLTGTRRWNRHRWTSRSANPATGSRDPVQGTAPA